MLYYWYLSFVYLEGGIIASICPRWDFDKIGQGLVLIYVIMGGTVKM